MFEIRGTIALALLALLTGCGVPSQPAASAPPPGGLDRLVRVVDGGTTGDLDRLLREEPQLLRPAWGGRVAPLEYALLHDRVDLVELLLDRGVDPGLPDAGGRTPLHVAIELESSDQVLQVLTKEGIDLNARDHDGRTPVHLAARSPSIRQLRFLIQHGARIDPRDAAGATPLHEAALNSTEHADYLLFCGAAADARTRDGATALHRAAEEGLLDSVVLLIARGAPVGVRDRKGRDPLQAARHGLEDLEALRGADRDPWFGRALDEELERQRACLLALQAPERVRLASEENWVPLGREEGKDPVDWFCDVNSLEPSLLEQGLIVAELARVSGAEIRYRRVRLPAREAVDLCSCEEVNRRLARLLAAVPPDESLFRAPRRETWSWYSEGENLHRLVPAAARRLRGLQRLPVGS